MKKVTTFIGSAHKRNTHDVVAEFLNKLKSLGDVECEIITLSDYSLGTCRGCAVCFEKGEEFCPLKDDRDILMDKIMNSDGVIFATPNYSFQVSGIMKVFLDRFGFVFHRPRYFGKTFTNIVVQGIGGGTEINKYLNFVGSNLGFNTVKGICITYLNPRTEKDQKTMNNALIGLSNRFYNSLLNQTYPVPSLIKLMLFRMGRTMVKQFLNENNRDFQYFSEKGWLESDYYYPTQLGTIKNIFGRLFDNMTPVIRKILA